MTQSPGPNGTDQFFQWSAHTGDGKLAVDYYDRQYGNDETTGSSDFSLSGSNDLTHFGQVRVTSSSMPAPTQFEGPNCGQFYGDYVWLSTTRDKAYPIWSDTRALDLFLCPGTATGPGNPPALVRRHRAERRGGQRRGDIHGGHGPADRSRSRARPRSTTPMTAACGARVRPGPTASPSR